MWRHAFPEQCHEVGTEELVVVPDAKRNDPADGAVMRKRLRKSVALMVFHDEYDVGPVEHALVDPDERVLAGPRRSNV